MPLARVLDQIERVFGRALEQIGINWQAKDDYERRQIALETVLAQVPVLWIWDNVEPVSGFPAGTPSAWSAAEQRELVDFLRAARDTRARFLLTSRRDERAWLGELPARVQLPPMPMQERVQLARALAARQGRRLGEVEDWRPLLRFTQGNPLTITVLVGQALRDGLRTKAQIGAFLERLYAGEANLLHARRLARHHGWWHRVTSAMQGLDILYDHTGRRGEWARLVDEIVPEYCDPETDGPLPGREEQWGLVTGYRVRLAMEARRWDEAERLQRASVEWNRQRAAPALAVPPEALDGAGRSAIRRLAVSVSQLADILREQGNPECVEVYQEDYDLSLRIDDEPGAAVTAFNLGRAYLRLPALRDLETAERWFRRSLELHDEGDRLGRGQCLIILGNVAMERFEDAQAADKGDEELLLRLNDAARFYHQALDLLPAGAVDDLATVYNQLGLTYERAGDLDRALPHFREAIRYWEAAGDLYNAGNARFNVAIALARAGRLPDALEYARAALRNFEPYGQGAAEMIRRARELIAEIEGEMGRG